MRVIYDDDAIYELKRAFPVDDFEKIIRCISRTQTADVVEVKHGEWVDRYNDGNWHCSICGAIVEKDEQTYRNWYWCYHCGAKMDKEGGADE